MLFDRVKQFAQRIFIRRGRFIENLQKLSDLIEKSELAGRVWIVGGLVLGLMREGKLLKHDFDADFAFFESDHDGFQRLIPILGQAGFHSRHRWTNSEGRVTEYTFLKNGAKFEFFIHTLSSDRKQVRWFAYHGRKKLEFERELPWHGTRQVLFLGRLWPIPDRTEKYLESQYGNWRIPDPHFDYTKPSNFPREVARRVWKGTRSWKI